VVPAIFLNRNFLFDFRTSTRLIRSNGFSRQGFRRFCSAVFPSVRIGAGFASGGPSTAEDAVFPIDSGDTSPCVSGVVIAICSTLRCALSHWRRQHRDLPQHAGKQPPRQMPFGQQQPVVARMLDEPSTGLHQPLLQAGQRPLPDPRGQRQPPPQIPEVIGDEAQPSGTSLARARPAWQGFPPVSARRSRMTGNARLRLLRAPGFSGSR
jgi:hypothetical protein